MAQARSWKVSNAIGVDASKHACDDGHINGQNPSWRNFVIELETFPESIKSCHHLVFRERMEVVYV